MTEAQIEPLVCRALGVKISRSALSLDKKERTVDVICSTDTIDAYGDSVEQVWDLKRYNANPILLYAHNSRELPIGTSENMRVESQSDGRRALVCTMRFASVEANPLAERVFQCFCEGILKTVSVGFIPHTIRKEIRNDREVWILTDNELHELSVTPVPANPDALAKHVARTAQPTTAPASVTKEKTMTEEEIKALVAKSVGEATNEIRATHAKELASRDAAIEAVTKSNAELAAKVAAGDAGVHSAEAKAKAAEAKALELEIDTLVGTKIYPAEKASFIELATVNRPIFDKMIKERPALKLLAPIVGEEIVESRETDAGASKSAGDELVEFISEMVSKGS